MEGHENCTCDPATHHHVQDSNGLVKLTLLFDLCIYNWLFVLIIIPTERQVHSNVLCHEPMKGLLSHAAGETD